MSNNPDIEKIAGEGGITTDQVDVNDQTKSGAATQSGGGGPPGSGGPSGNTLAGLLGKPWFLAGVGLIGAAFAFAAYKNLRGGS